jgi:ankyrin repeat protein
MAMEGIRPTGTQTPHHTTASHSAALADLREINHDVVNFGSQNTERPKGVLAKTVSFFQDVFHTLIVKPLRKIAEQLRLISKEEKATRPNNLHVSQATENQKIKIEEYKHLSKEERQNKLEADLKALLAPEKGNKKQLIDSLIALTHAGVNINKFTEFGTPLTEAVTYGNADLVKAFIQAGADVNKRTEKHGWFIVFGGITPLLKAVFQGHLDIVKILIQAGADVNKPYLASGKELFESGDTPLICAAREGYKNIVDELISAGAKINAPNHHGQTPLSASRGNVSYYPPIEHKMPKDNREHIAQLLKARGAKAKEE